MKQQENTWDRQKAEISKLLVNVFQKDPSAEGTELDTGSESVKAIVLKMAGLGIEIEPGSEFEKAMLIYVSGLEKKYSEYRNRISFWIYSMCLGDTICTTPTLRKIKELYPDHPIDVYSYFPEIFKYNTNADKTILFDPELEKDGQYSELRNFGYDRSMQNYKIAQENTEVNLSLTNLIDDCSLKTLNVTFEDHEKKLEVPVSIHEERSLLAKINHYGIDFNRAVIIHPSRTWITRTWPEKNWKELTRRLKKDGFQVIAVGKTAPVTDERLKVKGNENYGMQPCPEGAINLIDSLSVLETAYLLSLCKYVITMDSGIFHLALTTDIAIVAMFTVIDPKFRKAWRNGSFDYKLQVVPPNGGCYYCSNLKPDAVEKGGGCTQCPLGLNVQCLPTVEEVYKSFKSLL